MPDTAANGLIFYNSLYRHGVDEKRRVQIPAKWRPAEGDVSFTIIVWPKTALKTTCLLVLPPPEWLDLVSKLKSLPFSDAKAETLRRTIGINSDRVTTDKSGRICIPEQMAKAAGIENEAILVGMVDRFEIWSPDRYNASTTLNDEMSPEAFKMV